MRKCCVIVLLAWVLWEQMELRSPSKELLEDKWNVYVATETRAECDAALQRAWKVKLDMIKPVAQESGGTIIPAAPGFIIIITKDGGQVSSTFRCLPDTIDPRGPKQ